MSDRISDTHSALLDVWKEFRRFLRTGDLAALDRAYLVAHHAPVEIREAIRPLLICPPLARAVTARTVALKIEFAIRTEAQAELGQ